MNTDSIQFRQESVRRNALRVTSTTAVAMSSLVASVLTMKNADCSEK